MNSQPGRYPMAQPSSTVQGWTIEQITPSSRLFGANGLCTGPDGRIYVAQVSGSQISAIDIDSGVVETISPKGGTIVAPDDLVFDPSGKLYATEITEGRVSVREPGGRTRVVYGDMPCANPIAFHQGRLFAGECRPGGRIMELDLGGAAPRVLVDKVPMPNAMAVGPDGMLYFPVMGTNEIWRVDLDGGATEVVAADLGVPDAVKFDAAGKLVTTQVASGQVLSICLRTGKRTVLADIAPGLDNLSFVGERLFVSSISGQINEVLGDGNIRSLVPDGFNWPLGLAMGSDGLLFVADGPYLYTLRPGHAPHAAGMLFTPGYPGYVRGVIAAGSGEIIVTTANGALARYRPADQSSEELASGFDQLYGLAQTTDGAVIFAELGTGRVLCHRTGELEVLATDLNKPMGVAIAADNTCFISESGAGRVVALARGGVKCVLDDLQNPQGILVRENTLYVVDAGAKELVQFDLASGARHTIASGLPLGAPAGVTPKFLRGIGEMSGPMGPFAGIAGGAHGALYVSADASGSVLAVIPERRHA